MALVPFDHGKYIQMARFEGNYAGAQVSMATYYGTSAGATSILNQHGDMIYQDSDTGNIVVQKDTQNPSVFGFKTTFTDQVSGKQINFS